MTYPLDRDEVLDRVQLWWRKLVRALSTRPGARS